jgi:Asp-tRNA(Asn)/Glu-tRNA(Gln) amidotransferase A subunit family amidase
VSAELCHLSAREARERFAARRLSPVELLGALIARATALHGGTVNATVQIHAEQARAAAGEGARQ